MAKDAKFFAEFIQTIKESISVSLPCRVVSYDGSTKTADVQPLNLRPDGTKRGLIQDALVLKHVEKDIAAGKTVIVLFADCELDNLSSSNDFKPDSRRTHSVNDAVVIGVWDI